MSLVARVTRFVPILRNANHLGGSRYEFWDVYAYRRLPGGTEGLVELEEAGDDGGLGGVYNFFTSSSGRPVALEMSLTERPISKRFRAVSARACV